MSDLRNPHRGPKRSGEEQTAYAIRLVREQAWDECLSAVEEWLRGDEAMGVAVTMDDDSYPSPFEVRWRLADHIARVRTEREGE